jgi:hypothetical protein
MMPPRAASAPLIPYTANFTIRALTPLILAASSFPPTA